MVTGAIAIGALGVGFAVKAVFEDEVQRFWSEVLRPALFRWPVVCFFLGFIVGILVMAFAWRRQAQRDKADLAYLQEIRDVDAALWPMLAGLPLQATDPAVALERLLRQYLRQLGNVIYPDGVVAREAIFVPTEDRKRLRPLVTEPEVAGAPGRAVVCNIDFPDGQPHGDCSSASAAFLTGKLRVAHFDKANGGQWACDDKQWYYTPSDREMPHYRAVASVPLLDATRHAVGVISIASATRDLFDSDVIKEALEDMARRAACVLVWYHALFPGFPLVRTLPDEAALPAAAAPTVHNGSA